jgi:hypothetical protein
MKSGFGNVSMMKATIEIGSTVKVIVIIVKLLAVTLCFHFRPVKFVVLLSVSVEHYCKPASASLFLRVRRKIYHLNYFKAFPLIIRWF